MTNTPILISLNKVNAGTNEVRFITLRGFYYKLQSAPDLTVPFSDEPGGSSLACNSSLARTNTTAGSQKYYRAVRSPVP